MRKTKIVCTIGPACANEETLTKMCLAGMNVARLNFSHGTHESHQVTIDLIKKVRDKLNLPIAILLDTKGPEYRIRTFESGKITLNEGDAFTFTTEDIVGDQERVSISYESLPQELAPGDTILLNNGLMTFKVTGTTETEVQTVVVEGGVLSDRKSMAFPGKVLRQVYLSEQDKADILFGVANDVDFIACSFVSEAQNIRDIKNLLHEHNVKGIDLIAKIENRAGVDNIEEICDECDGIMVARGDLGVEIPFEELPGIQKHLITKCRLLGKMVITATEMLESMIEKPRPTRAEISDVANAVYDGTSAIMLSGETASGKHPVLVVQTMARIAEEAERGIDFGEHFRTFDFNIHNTVDAISHATCGMAIDVGAKVIAVCSLSGKTVRMVSRFRCPVDILGVTTDVKSWRKLGLSWGVCPALSEQYNSTDVLFYMATRLAKENFDLKSGDRIVITGGASTGKSGGTNLIKIENI